MIVLFELLVAVVRSSLKQLSSWFFTEYIVTMLFISFQWALLYGFIISMGSKVFGTTIKRKPLIREVFAVWLVLATVSEPGRFVLFCLMWEGIGSGNMVQYVRWSWLLGPEPKTPHTFAATLVASVAYRVLNEYKFSGWLKGPLASVAIAYLGPYITVLLAQLEHGYPNRSILRF